MALFRLEQLLIPLNSLVRVFRANFTCKFLLALLNFILSTLFPSTLTARLHYGDVNVVQSLRSAFEKEFFSLHSFSLHSKTKFIDDAGAESEFSELNPHQLSSNLSQCSGPKLSSNTDEL
jgi:hypothetical protein